jgi:hypothetical protein
MSGMGCQQCHDTPCTCERKTFVATFTVRVEMTLTHPPKEECEELKSLIHHAVWNEAPDGSAINVGYTIAEKEVE